MTDTDTTTQHDKEPIAIIGMSCVFPESANLKQFWNNILNGVDAVSEPQADWDAERYLQSERINTPYGGFLNELFSFDPKPFGIMPNSIDGGEPDHFLALRVAAEALDDSGYLNSEYDHSDTGIILGHSTYLHRGQVSHVQHHIVLDQATELIKAAVPDISDDDISAFRSRLAEKLPQSNADVAAGLVPNVMTGRIANRLNLKGVNYILDAACSSSLLAVGAAMTELRSGNSRMMLAGGVNASLPAEVAVIFTQLGALSKRGKVRPFDKNSDGTLLGEGLGVVVLKRLSDAEQDGDKIYAVLRGVGHASDGKGLGLLAPNYEGEKLAIERAYANADVDPRSLSLIEAHGTGIPLGDKTEIAALKSILGERDGALGHVALGSVKSMISHCIPAAGIAGLIKNALALHHKILPPTLCEELNPDLGIEKTTLYVNTQVKPWILGARDRRRAGINSFGFGGINAHAILEEAPASANAPSCYSDLPSELVIFTAHDNDTLKADLETVVEHCQSSSSSLAEIAKAAYQRQNKGPCRLAIVAKDNADLAKKINQSINKLGNGKSHWTTRTGVVYAESPIGGDLAFVFPGEGSQYLGMIQELAIHFPEVRQWFDFWSALYDDQLDRTDILFPPPLELNDSLKATLEQRLYSMDLGSEAAFIGGQAVHSLLRSFGVTPDVMLGHSTGETSALVASGAIPGDDLPYLASTIQQLNKVYQHVLDTTGIPKGCLLSVGGLSRTIIEESIESQKLSVCIAMDNCENQQIVYGDTDSIAVLDQHLSTLGGICIPLPFDRGYHTSDFTNVSKAFYDFYQSIGLKAPLLPLYSCATAGKFDEDPEKVRSLAAQQWSQCVRFSETIEAMYNDGVRTFVEVGPSANLTAFISSILSGKTCVSIASDVRKKNSVEQFQLLLGTLFVQQKDVNLGKLFDGRCIDDVDLTSVNATPFQGRQIANTLPMIRLNDDDKQFIRSIVDTPQQAPFTESTPNVDQIEPTLHADAPTSLEVGEQHDLVQRLNSETEADRVMVSYFDMMNELMTGQTHIAHYALENDDALVDEPLPQEAEAVPFPFIDDIQEQTDDYLLANVYLNVYQDIFLQDHVLSGQVSDLDPSLTGLSCVPFMVSLEIMAEAVCLLAQRQDISAIEDVAAFDWIALDEGELSLSVSVTFEPESGKYTASVLRAGELVVKANYCFDTPPTLPSLELSSHSYAYHWSPDELYTTGMFHGPVFQSIAAINSWNETSITADLSDVSVEGFFDGEQIPSLVLNPVLLDAMGQLVAFWIAEQVGTDFNSFPSTIKRIECYQPVMALDDGAQLLGCQRNPSDRQTTAFTLHPWDLECRDAHGAVIFRVEALDNIYFPVPHTFYQVRKDPLRGWFGGPIRGTVDSPVLLWGVPYFDNAFCSQSNGIFMRIIAHCVLGREELSQWHQLNVPLTDKKSWLFTRVCIKEAVRAYIYQNSGQLVYSSDIHIDHQLPNIWSVSIAGEPVDGIPKLCVSQDSSTVIVAVSSELLPLGLHFQAEHDNTSDHDTTLLSGEMHLLERIDQPQRRRVELYFVCAKKAAETKLGKYAAQFTVTSNSDDYENLRLECGSDALDVTILDDNYRVIALAQ